MPTTAQAKKAWEHMRKGKNYYEAMTPEQKSAAWQYGRDNGLFDPNGLDNYKKSEFSKYVNTEWSRYEPNITPSKLPDVMKYDSHAAYQGPKVPLTNNGGSYTITPPAQPKKGKDLEWGGDSSAKVEKPAISGGIVGRTPINFNPNKLYPQNNVVAKETLRTLNTAATAIPSMAVESVKGGKEGGILGSIKGIGKGFAKAANFSNDTNSKAIEEAYPETTNKLKQQHPIAYNVASGTVDLIGLEDLLGLGAITNAAKVAKLKALPETTKALIKASEKDLAQITTKVKAGVALTNEETNLINTIRKDLDIESKGGNVNVSKGVPKPDLLEKVRMDLGITPKLNKTTLKAPIAKEIPQGNTKPLPNAKITVTEELANNPTYKEITEELKNSKVTPDENIKTMAPTIKDKSGLTLNIKDMYRNMRDIFGKSYEYVKKNYIDPFDASKKTYTDEVKKYTDDIYNKVVKGLGINKGTPESAAVQWYGEGVKVIDGKEIPYTKEDLIKDFGQKKANRIMEADKVFRQAYNELIDKVNNTRKMIYPNNPEKEVPRRSDYYRHFNEMAEGFKGLKNIFETPAMIDPKLAGMSEFTKPNSRWASFMQKRGNGSYTADAVGGFLNYIQPAAYSIHIDPHIKNFRSLAKDIAEATQDTKNANNTIKYLNDFANNLAGKTSKYDRVLQEDIPGGRTAFNAINWLNGRVKSNQVLMNAQSALSQFANVPVGVAKVKNPIAITKGAGQTLAGIVGKGNKAIAKSQFINERYIGDLLNRFDKKLTQQPKKFAAWLLEGADKLGTTFTWNSAYNKAAMQGIKDPVKYADDLTRSIVAGRGIGEVPLLQQAKSFQLVAPFQLEVANLWHVLGDSVKEKDVAGIAMILLGNYLFNNATESLTGNRVTFDPVNAMIEALTEDDTNAGKVTGRVAGEVLSNVPLGQTIAAMYPEYGADISTPIGSASLPSRKALFGDEDPTRFGGGLLVTKALTDPLYKVALPFGGAQAKKTIEGLQAVNKGMVEKNGKLSFPVEKTTENTTKAALFGKYATNEARDYFNKDRRPLSVQQTKDILKQPDLKKAYEKKMAERRMDTLKDKIKEIRKDETLTWNERQKKISELQVQINNLKLGL